MTLDVNRPDLTVGVVGTGAMGRGIAQVTAQGGMRAILFDAAPGGAAKAKAAILETLKGLVAKGRLSDEDLARTNANLAVADKLDDLKSCHVVVEAVFENLEVKQKLFGELEAVVSPDTILSSNTSSIRIASIARSLKKRDRVCGMHYFNPVPLMKLVEVIRAADTSQATVDAMVALGKRQTRVPVVVGDTPGFLVNLGGTAIGTEGLRIYQEGRASPSQIDAVMRDSCGFRMGPFELMDLTGIDVNFPARKIIYEGFFHDRRMTPSPYHEGLFHAGRLGRKTGGGWYGYDDKGGKLDPGADHATSAVPAASVVVMDSHNEKLVALVMAAGAKALGADDGKSPILVAPVGKDCTTTAVELGLDPKRTVAIDLTGDTAKRVTHHDRTQRRSQGARCGGFAARQDRRQRDLDQGFARLHRPAHGGDDRQSRLRDGDDRHRLGGRRRHRDDARPQLPARAAGAGRLAGRQGLPRDPGPAAGHHRRRPLPAEPVAAPAEALLGLIARSTVGVGTAVRRF
jgi:3-hydroxybutyryl-CoA dehydrogenase